MWVVRRSVEEIQVSLRSNKNKAYLTLRTIYIFIACRSFLLRMRNVSGKYCRGNQNTQFVFDNVFLISYRLRDKVEKYFRTGQATDDNMAHAHCVSTSTHSEYIIFYFHCNNGYTAHLNVSFLVHWLSC
jgi:hypothetical protein